MRARLDALDRSVFWTAHWRPVSPGPRRALGDARPRTTRQFFNEHHGCKPDVTSARALCEGAPAFCASAAYEPDDGAPLNPAERASLALWVASFEGKYDVVGKLVDGD